MKYHIERQGILKGCNFCTLLQISALASICLYSTHAVSDAAIKANGVECLSLNLVFDSKASAVEVVAKNVGERDLEIYDSLSSKFAVPYFLAYTLRDDRHGVITKFDQHGDGYISSNIFKSSLLEPSEGGDMTVIPPHGEISSAVNIKDLLGGTLKYWTVKPSEIDDAHIKFKIKIFLDKNFTKYVDAESIEYQVKGSYLRNFEH